MITRSLMGEIETALLQAHTRILSNRGVIAFNETQYLQAASQKDALLKELLALAQERRSSLEKEIEKAGYANYAEVANDVYRFVESKLRMEITGPGSSAKVLERANFEKLARKIKTEAQTIFFKNYSTRS